MQAQLKSTFNNSYEISLIDSKTYEVKQEGVFHNIATTDMLSSIIGVQLSQENQANTGKTRILSTLAVGSGTTPPDITETRLVNELWATTASSRSFEWVNDYTCRSIATFVFPATTAYVGTVTEVGVYCRNYYTMRWTSDDTVRTSDRSLMCTRALLTDSEGQQISFEKTDLDILKITVTIELSLHNNSVGFTLFKRPFILLNTLMGFRPHCNDDFSDRDDFRSYGGLRLFRFYRDLDAVQLYDSTGADYWSNVDTGISGIVPWATHPTAHIGNVNYPVGRLLATQITSDRYYKAVGIPGIGYWKLPNESLLPSYKISMIPIGMGDGSTVTFTNPMNYFKKDSETIYKNGEPLVRGVDYLINHNGNKDCLPELADMDNIPKVTSQARDVSLMVRPYIIPTACAPMHSDRLKEFFGEDIAYSFSEASPLYIEYDTPVTRNCVKCSGGLRHISTGGGYSNIPVGTNFYVDYSLDGENYVELGSASLVTANGPFDIHFDNITAKFWRIRTSYKDVVCIYENGHYLTLNYKEPYITFTTPPAEGAALTMDVEMDIIFKNSNFVVDIGANLEFSI